MARKGNNNLGCLCLLLCCCIACPEILLALITLFLITTFGLNKDHIPGLNDFLENYFYKPFGKTATNIMLPVAPLFVFACWCFIRACCSTSCVGSTLLCGLGDSMRPHQKRIKAEGKDYGTTSPASPPPVFIDETPKQPPYKIIPLTNELLVELYRQLTDSTRSMWDRCNNLFDFVVNQLASLVLLSSCAQKMRSIKINSEVTLFIPDLGTIQLTTFNHKNFKSLFEAMQSQKFLAEHDSTDLKRLVRNNPNFQKTILFLRTLVVKVDELIKILENPQQNASSLLQQIIQANRDSDNTLYERNWNLDNARRWIQTNIDKLRMEILKEMADGFDWINDMFLDIEEDNESMVEGASDTPLSPSTSRDPLMPSQI